MEEWKSCYVSGKLQGKVKEIQKEIVRKVKEERKMREERVEKKELFLSIVPTPPFPTPSHWSPFNPGRSARSTKKGLKTGNEEETYGVGGGS